MTQEEAQFFIAISRASSLREIWKILKYHLWPQADFEIIKPIRYIRTTYHGIQHFENQASYIRALLKMQNANAQMQGFGQQQQNLMNTYGQSARISLTSGGPNAILFGELADRRS